MSIFPPIHEFALSTPAEPYDLDAFELMPVSSEKTNVYVCIKDPSNYDVFTVLPHDELQVDPTIYDTVLVLSSVDRLVSTETEFPLYVQNTIEYVYADPEYRYVTVLRITVSQEYTGVVFSMDGIECVIRYPNVGPRLTSVLVSEFFRSIADYPMSHVFEFSFRGEFRVRHSELSVIEFLESKLMAVYGSFRRGNGLSELLSAVGPLSRPAAFARAEFAVPYDVFMLFFTENAEFDPVLQMEMVNRRRLRELS